MKKKHSMEIEAIMDVMARLHVTLNHFFSSKAVKRRTHRRHIDEEMYTCFF